MRNEIKQLLLVVKDIKDNLLEMKKIYDRDESTIMELIEQESKSLQYITGKRYVIKSDLVNAVSVEIVNLLEQRQVLHNALVKSHILMI